MTFIVLTLAASAVAGTIVTVARDGYSRRPTV
jgi:hypothetical protein